MASKLENTSTRLPCSATICSLRSVTIQLIFLPLIICILLLLLHHGLQIIDVDLVLVPTSILTVFSFFRSTSSPSRPTSEEALDIIKQRLRV